MAISIDKGSSQHHSALGSVIAGMIVTVLIFPKFEAVSIGQGVEAGVRLFAMAFGFGFGWHAIVDEVAKWAVRSRP